VLQTEKSVDVAVRQAAPLTQAQRKALAADIELEINALRNAAYAQGMASTQAAIAATVLGEWK
jgi:hypothetical protein